MLFLALKKVQMVKNTPQIPTTQYKNPPEQNFSFLPLGGFSPPLNVISKTLRCLQLIYTYRRTGVLIYLNLHTKGRGGTNFE